MLVEGVMGYEHAPSLMHVSTEAIASDPSQMTGIPGKRGLLTMDPASAEAAVLPR
jgi:hypothetical protein